MKLFFRVIRASFLKEIRILRRNKTKIGLMVVFPLMFWSSFVLLMGGVYSQGVEAGLVVLEQNRGYFTEGLIEILSEPDDIPPSLALTEMDNDTAATLFESGDIMLVIIIPEGFESSLSNNETASIQIWVNNMHEDMTKNLRMPVIRKLDIFYQAYLGNDSLVDFEYSLLKPHTYPRLGYMAWTMSIYAIMFGAMLSTSSMISQEFEEHTIEEIEMADRSLFAINAGKMTVGVIVCFIAPPILLLLGFVTFQIWPEGDLVSYLCLSLPLAIISSGIGLVIGSITRNSVYVVPLSALLSLFYWVMGGGMAPLLIVGIAFEIMNEYSPISNAYRSLVQMFLNGASASMSVDMAILWLAAVMSMVFAPMLASRLSRVDISRFFWRRATSSDVVPATR